jgi:hypothetical protein
MRYRWAFILSSGQFFRPQRPPPEEPEEAPPPLVQYRDTSYIPQEPVKSSRRFLPGFLLALAGLVVLLGSLSAPWYSYAISGKVWVGNVYYSVYDQDEYSFSGIHSVEEKNIPGFTLAGGSTQSWGDYDARYNSAHHRTSRLSGVYSTALVILVAGVTLCALGAFLSAVFRLRKKPLLFPVVVLLSGALVAMTGAGAFSAWHQSAFEADGTMAHTPDYYVNDPSGPGQTFSGESNRSPLRYEWGPSYGWHLALVGPAMVILGAVLLYWMNRGQA